MGESSWQSFKLEELVENFDSMRVPVKEADRKKGPFAYYGASGVIDYIEEYIYDGEYLLIAEDGENLRARKTPIAFLAQGKFWVNNHAHVVKGNDKGDTKFLMYALQATDISGYISGTTVPKLSQASLNEIRLFAPPLREQHRIAHILGTLDNKIELNRRMNATLEAIAQAIFKSWFVDFAPVRAKVAGRPSGLPAELDALFPDSFVESELGEIPKGWAVTTLGEISKKPQYGYTASASDMPVGPKFIRITDINKSDWIMWEKVPFCKIDDADLAKYKVARGDLLIARMADPGHAVVVDEVVDAVFASYLIRFKLIRDILIRYVQYWTRSDLYWNIVAAWKKGTTRPSLNAQDLSAFKLCVPNQTVALAFAKVISSLRDRIIQNAAESRKLAELRDLILPWLMNGSLVKGG